MISQNFSHFLQKFTISQNFSHFLKKFALHLQDNFLMTYH